MVEEEGEPEDRPEAGAVPILGVRGKVLTESAESFCIAIYSGVASGQIELTSTCMKPLLRDAWVFQYRLVDCP